MDLRTRHFGRCAEPTSETDIQFDAAAFVEHLLLFETCILDSVSLREFPHLVRAFGLDPVLTLLKSGALKVHASAATIGQVGQTAVLGRTRETFLPLNTFSFVVVSQAEPGEMISRFMAEMSRSMPFQGRGRLKLKSAVADALLPHRDDEATAASRQLHSDLRLGSPILRPAVSLALRRNRGMELGGDQLAVSVDALGPNEFRVTSNLKARAGLDERQEHELLETAFLALGGLNQRLEWMQAFSAVSGLQDGELSLFEDKLLFLAREIDPDVQQGRLQRVLALSPFPDLSGAIAERRLNLERVLDIRQSAECREFRAWLWGIDSASDIEILERFGSLRARLASLAGTTSGRVIRWGATTGLGVIPVVGTILGAGAGLLDTFLLDSILRVPGPTVFLSRLYPSIFREAGD